MFLFFYLLYQYNLEVLYCQATLLYLKLISLLYVYLAHGVKYNDTYLYLLARAQSR